MSTDARQSSTCAQIEEASGYRANVGILYIGTTPSESGCGAPFRGSSDVPQTEATGCLRDGEVVTLAGTLIKRRAADPDGLEDFPELRLASPACIYRFGSLQPFQPAVEVVLLEAPVGTTFSPPSQAFGKPMQVTGRLRDAVSKYDVEPNVLTMTPNRR